MPPVSEARPRAVAGIRRLALVSGAVVLAACGDGEPAREAPAPALAGAGVSWTVRVLDGSDELARPGDIAVVGKHLVMINNGADSVIRVYGAESGELRLTFGRKGRGPGEFEGAWSIDPVPGSDDAFWIYDLGLQRLTKVDLAADFAPSRSYGRRTISLQGGGAPTSPVWLGDSVFISPGYYVSAARLAYFDTVGRMVRVVGPPPPGDAAAPVAVRQHAYQSTARPNPARTHIAVATRHADRLEVYRPDGSLVASAPRPEAFEPLYDVAMAAGEPTMVTGDSFRFGYIDLATTERYVYALYSGLRRGDASGHANFGRVIRVFDWSARPVATLRLDRPVFSIAADPADRRIYAVAVDPSPSLISLEFGAEGP